MTPVEARRMVVMEVACEGVVEAIVAGGGCGLLGAD